MLQQHTCNENSNLLQLLVWLMVWCMSSGIKNVPCHGHCTHYANILDTVQHRIRHDILSGVQGLQTSDFWHVCKWCIGTYCSGGDGFPADLYLENEQ